jgi:hypothetical protein
VLLILLDKIWKDFDLMYLWLLGIWLAGWLDYFRLYISCIARPERVGLAGCEDGQLVSKLIILIFYSLITLFSINDVSLDV